MSIDVIADATAGPFAAACAVLGFAGIAKIRRPAATHTAAAALGLPASPVAVRTLGVIEIGAAALGLLFGGWAAAGVAVVYFALAVAAWRLHVSAPGTACGCLGASDAPVSVLHIWVNVGAALVATLAIAAGPPLAAVGDSVAARLAFVLLVGCCAALVATVLDTIPAARRCRAMTAVVVIESVVLVLLTVVVIGLLRSHAEILQQLHALGAGLDPDAQAEGAPISLRPRGDLPRAGEGLGPAADLSGAGLHDDAVMIPVVGVRHRTLLAFLSSGCLTCRGFWDAFDRPATLGLPADVRLVVVTKDAAEESVHTLRELAPRDLAVVMSNAAWEHYAVPGSPYFALVDGTAGRVVGEGTGASWDQVQSLLTHATGDEAAASGPIAGGAAATEARIDLELLASGIEPGDARLYRTADELTPDASG